MAKVQGASLRRSLDGRRKTRKVSRSVARERAIISTTLLSRKRSWGRLCFSICACHPCAKEVITPPRTMIRLENRTRPWREIHTAELIRTEYTCSGGASDSIQ